MNLAVDDQPLEAPAAAADPVLLPTSALPTVSLTSLPLSLPPLATPAIPAPAAALTTVFPAVCSSVAMSAPIAAPAPLADVPMLDVPRSVSPTHRGADQLMDRASPTSMDLLPRVAEDLVSSSVSGRITRTSPFEPAVASRRNFEGVPVKKEPSPANQRSMVSKRGRTPDVEGESPPRKRSIRDAPPRLADSIDIDLPEVNEGTDADRTAHRVAELAAQMELDFISSSLTQVDVNDVGKKAPALELSIKLSRAAWHSKALAIVAKEKAKRASSAGPSALGRRSTSRGNSVRSTTAARITSASTPHAAMPSIPFPAAPAPSQSINEYASIHSEGWTRHPFDMTLTPESLQERVDIILSDAHALPYDRTL
ncbi:hypothetical protein BDK51DRAFT_50247, partial [Blyttiomyces helicus]